MTKWTPVSKRTPKRFNTVWITTTKGKVRMAYLDGGDPPRWGFPNNKKSIAYEDASAWMEVEVPEPYKEEKEE